MTAEVQFGSLLVVALAAFTIPLLLALLPHEPIPAMVGEVLAGIVLGKSGLGWIVVGPWLEFLFLFGLAFLLFLAGLEIDSRLRRVARPPEPPSLYTSPTGLAVIGLAVRLVLAFAITAVLAVAGLLSSPTLGHPARLDLSRAGPVRRQGARAAR